MFHLLIVNFERTDMVACLYGGMLVYELNLNMVCAIRFVHK